MHCARSLWVPALLLLVLLLTWSSAVCTAHAEHVTIHTRKAGMVTGELVEYAKDRHAVVRIGDGNQTMRVAASDIESLVVSGARPKACQLQATARLKSGAALSGVLVDYVLYKHARISLGVGEPTRLESTQLTAVELAGGFGPRCESAATSQATPTQETKAVASPSSSKRQLARQTDAPPAAPQSLSASLAESIDPAARAAGIQALMNERADWQARDTGLAAPLAFTLAGIAVAGGGAGLIVASVDEHWHLGPGIATLAVGGAALATGLVLWVLRTSDRRQRLELERIDQQLRLFGLQTSVSPWLVPQGASPAAVAAGITVDGRF